MAKCSVKNREERDKEKVDPRPSFSQYVIDQVESRLGTPENLDRITAIDVDPDNYFHNGKRYYRVNVAVQVSDQPPTDGWVLGRKFKPVYPDSFFIITDDNGDILESRPEIKQKYPIKNKYH
jgi:hypothetical protein